MEATQPPRFTRINTVVASYRDHVCYLGLDSKTGVQVFWYEFINNSLSDEQRTQGLQQLQAAKRIQSKYLLQILDVHVEGANNFVVITEGTQAPSVYDYVRSIETPPLLKTILKWFKSCCLAVQALHKENVIHGSLSPHTCYIKRSTGAFKLALPLARLSVRAVPPCTLDIDEYVSPEKLQGGERKANDIWALGITLLELVTQKSAYSEYKSPQDLINAILHHKMPASLSLVENPHVADLIGKCLEPEITRLSIDEVLEHPVLNESTGTSPPQGDKDLLNLLGSETIIELK